MRVALVAIAAVAACGDGVPKPAQLAPLSAEQATELARRFEAAVEPCVAAKLDALFDTEQLTRAVVARSHLDRAEKRETLAQLRARGPFLGEQLCLALTTTNAFALVRIAEIDGEQRPLFRALGSAGVNYYEVRGGVAKDGALRVVDLYVYLSGETLIETMATTLDRSASAARRGDTPDLGPINAAKARGDFDQVRQLIAKLPGVLRDSKALRLMDLQAAIALDAPNYVDVIDRYATAFPGDPSVDLVTIDAYFKRQQVPQLLAAVDRLDHRIGGDPYLDYLRSAGLLLEPTSANLVESDRRARVAIAAVPDHVDLWWHLVAVQLARDDHAGVVPTLDKLANDFAISFDRDAMAASPLWVDFLASPEFAAWWPTQASRSWQ